jgi:cleavage and polyadenylation specificity factor subunit 3
MSGAKVPLNMSVHYVSFSAHADYAETSEFVDLLRPPHVVLVHGDSNEMGRLQSALKQKYDGTLPLMQILAPKNCQTLEFEFRRQKIAKAVGNAAARAPVDGAMLRGLLVRKDFNYTIMETEDLSSYTPLSSTTVTQTLKVYFVIVALLN